MMRRLALAAVSLLLLLAGCGGDEGSAVEDQEFIVELEIPLTQELDEPEVYGQAGMSPNGRNGTRVVIRLDKPFKSPMEAFIRRGGCSSFRGFLGRPDYDLGEVKGGKLDTEVDAPTRDLRSGYVIVVREPLSKADLEKSRDRVRGGGVFEKGACGDISSADRVDEF
jgi:hypothetical protein